MKGNFMDTHGYTVKEKREQPLGVTHLMKPSSVMEESVQRGFEMVNLCVGDK